jgi:hypothetical protein
LMKRNALNVTFTWCLGKQFSSWAQSSTENSFQAECGNELRKFNTGTHSKGKRIELASYN